MKSSRQPLRAGLHWKCSWGGRGRGCRHRDILDWDPEPSRPHPTRTRRPDWRPLSLSGEFRPLIVFRLYPFKIRIQDFNFPSKNSLRTFTNSRDKMKPKCYCDKATRRTTRRGTQNSNYSRRDYCYPTPVAAGRVYAYKT